MSSDINYLFCSLSDRPEFSEPMFHHLSNYCSKHNYKCVLEEESLDTSRYPAWSKIKLLQREMKNNPKIHTIVWIDDDILITNQNLKFEDLIRDYTFENILMSEEIHPPFNSGVMVCKNNQTTYDYLEHIWNLCEEHPRYKQDGLWEQSIMGIDYQSDKSKIKLIPHNIIQSFYRDWDLPENLKWKPGHWAAHITGMDLSKRIYFRNEIINNHLI